MHGDDFDSAFDAATAELNGQAAGGEQASAPALPTESAAPVEGAPPGPAEFEFHKDWSKETRDSLQSLLTQPDGRKYLEAMHKQYGTLDERFRGVQSRYDQTQSQFQQFGQAIAPYVPFFQMRGEPAPQVIGRALAWAQHLYQNPQEGLRNLARELGVEVGGGKQQDDPNAVWVDPAITTLEQKLMSRLEQAEARLQQVDGTFQGMTQQSIMSQIHAFRQAVDDAGNPKAPYFDELLEDITREVYAGHSLEKAYKLAAYANEAVWSKLEADKAKAAGEQARKDAAARLAEAQKAVRGNSSRSPPGNGQGDVKAKPRNKDEAFDAAFSSAKAEVERRHS